MRDALSSNIRALRRQRGISQDELAFRAGMHRTYLSDIERTARNVTLDVVERLAAALSVEPWRLLKPGEMDADGGR
ncbi:MAG: XRE family transcriptional regulator [Ancylobacter novellus]|uniref:XRE family transcriptional regulator n=1 Tax=Ancylobacter novellus TaxID=921 RepID=A0A2W5KQ80_ANCNO|nr:MAG: XRE family transcriptional regulator [Ancylobacter novellus]